MRSVSGLILWHEFVLEVRQTTFPFQPMLIYILKPKCKWDVDHLHRNFGIVEIRKKLHEKSDNFMIKNL